jgi:dolichol kinase
MGSIFPLVYYFSPNKWIPLVILGVLLIPILLCEWARKRYSGFWSYITGITAPKGKWYIKITKRIFKTKPGRILGTTYFLVGTLITILFFSKSIAICVLLFTVFGDAASAIVGTKYGSIKLIGKKSLQGTLAFLIVCLLVGFGLVNLPGITLLPLLILVGAVIATLVELLPIPIDDNLTVPIITGVLMEIVRLI